MDKILTKIMSHLDYLQLCQNLSWNVSMMSFEDIDKINMELDNRERLISIVAKLQLEIETLINELSGSELSPNNVQIIKSWNSDTHTLVSNIMDIDDKINQSLESQKKVVGTELKNTFENVEKFKGYNLQSVRK